MRKYLKLEKIIPLVHFLLSFAYEHLIFNFGNNFDIQNLTPINLRFSDRFEIVMAYAISKAIAFVLIVCVWKLIFAIIKKEIRVSTSVLFSIIFVVGAVLLLILFPGSLMMAMDNYITYAQAVNFVPGYWHSIYTSCFYAGCMMVIPSPYMIVLFHWLGLVYGIGYIYNRIDESDVISSKFKYPILVIFALPYVCVMLMDAYRSELYCVLCVIFIGIVVLDIIEKKSRSMRDFISVLLLAAIISVWRSEGIILGLGAVMVLTLFVYSGNAKEKIIKLFLFVCVVFAMLIPQKIGDIKYYGNDYKIVNITYPLGHILNDPEANLSYDGAEEDLQAIDTFMPVSYLKEYYLDGYRRRNVAVGSKDINQSMSALEYSDAFVKAGYRIIMHNPKPYLVNQWNFLNIAFETYKFIDQPEYSGEPNNAAPWTYDLWDKGEKIFYETKGVKAWAEWQPRVNAEEKILEAREKFLEFFYYYRFGTTYSFLMMINIGTFACILVLAIFETIRWFVKRDRRDAFLLIPWIVIAQFVGIFLFMPSGMPTYFRGVFFASYVILLTYPARVHVFRKSSALVGEK